jgi:hypothetical protein
MRKIPISLIWSMSASCLLFVFLSLFAFNNKNILSNDLYSYDEADYRYAAEKGFLTNYLDRGSLSFGAFLAKGMKAGLNKTEWGRLSKFIRASDDITFYRHFHGPLYFYWLIATKTIGFDSEKLIRYGTLLLALFCTLAFSLLLFGLFPHRPSYMVVPFIAALLLGPSIILTYNHLTPHGFFVIFSSVSLGCMALYCKENKPRFWYGSIIAAALAFLTLEYAALLILVLLITLWIFRKTHAYPMTKPERRRFLYGSVLCFVLPILVLWPGGLLKLTIIKNYLFYAYFTFIRGDLYSSFSFHDVWSMRVQESPVEYAVLLLGLIALPFMIKKNQWMISLALYTLFILATGFRNLSTYPQYLTSVFPALYLFAAAGFFILLDKKSAIVRSFAAGILTAAIAANSYIFFTFFAPHSWQRTQPEITSLKDITPLLSGNHFPLFVSREYIPTLHYYFPQARLNPYNQVFEDNRTVTKEVSNFIKKHGGSVLILINNRGRELSELIKSELAVENEWNLFFSEREPNVICYQLSLKQ